MSDQRIDRMFQQNLFDGSMQVADGAWDRLEPFLPQSRKRDRGAIFWWTGLGVLAVSALVWSLTYFTGTHETTSAASAHTLSAMTPTSGSHGTGAAAVLLTSDSAHEQGVVSEGAQQEVNSEVPAATLHPAGSTTEIPSSGMQTSAIVSQFKAKTPAKNAGVQVKKAVEENAVGNTADNSDVAGENAVAETAEQHSEVQITRATDADRRTGFLMFALPLEMEPRALPDPAKDCYDFGGRSGGAGSLFAEVYTGPTLSARKLSSRLESVPGYINLRDSTERMQLSWHAGVRLGYATPSGISLRVGAHYTLVNEAFDYTSSTFSQTEVRYDTILDMQGTILDIDTITVVTTGRKIRTTQNRYHALDIPILFGYQATRDHWTYGIQAGPVLNVLHKKKGIIFSPQDVIVPITDGDAMQYAAFKDQLGVSLYASVHLGRRIGYRTAVFVEPYLQHRLKSVTLDSYPVEQKQTNFGLSLGLRVGIN